MSDWLFSSGNCSRGYAFGERERVDFWRGPVRAYLEETPVLPGIWLYRGEASGRSRFGIAVDGGPPDRGRMILGTMLSARGVFRMEGCDEQTWREDGRVYALTPVERAVSYDIVADAGWRIAAVKLEPEALDILGADGALPYVVRQTLEGRLENLSDGGPLPGPLRALGHQLLRSPYEGPMQTIFRQGKVLEMLARLFEGLGADRDEAPGLPSNELARVRLARERLLADLRDPPDLETLARDVGLSPKRLNRGFRSLYGTTVFTFLRDARLDAARAALEAGTPLSLKQLAWELGYGQVTNFVTAFRRRFGVPPGAWRDGGGEP